MPEISGYRLAGTRTAIWPTNEITFRVPAGTTWGTLMTCSDTFAGAFSNLRRPALDNSVATTVNGTPDDGTSGIRCSTRVDPGTIPPEVPPAATTTTVTLAFMLGPIYDHRNGIIQIGIYYRD